MDTEETRKWIEMELEDNDTTQRMMGSFSVFLPWQIVFRAGWPRLPAFGATGVASPQEVANLADRSQH